MVLAGMDIEMVLKKLYESGINCSISGFWDGGWDVKLGDELNGFKAKANFRTLDECADFLDVQARIHCPEAAYSLGAVEHYQRRTVRVERRAGRWK
jgi:hypothetical protein